MRKNVFSWHNVLNSKKIAADVEEKLANQGEVLRGGIRHIYLFIFPYQRYRNHAMNSSTVGHVIPERQWKSTFNFTEIVHNYGLKRGTICQIVRFISHFSLKLYMETWKIFTAWF